MIKLKKQSKQPYIDIFVHH